MNDTLAASLPDAGDANLDNHAQGLTLAGSRHSEHLEPVDTNGSLITAVIAAAVAA